MEKSLFGAGFTHSLLWSVLSKERGRLSAGGRSNLLNGQTCPIAAVDTLIVMVMSFSLLSER